MIRKTIILVAVTFAVLMSIPDNEGHISFAVENTWAARASDPGESSLRFLRFRSSEAPRPAEELGFLVGNRLHFGWPCWAVYLDSGREIHSGGDIWYMKIDLWKSAANLLVAILTGIGASFLLWIVHRNRANPAD